jgi:hypothetical protein
MSLCAIIGLVTVQAVAAQSANSPANDSTVATATATTAPVDQQTYTRRAEGEMQEWETKLHAFHEKAKAAGESAGSASESKLQDAWVKVKAASHGLQTAGGDTWEGAKHAYEEATNELASAWQTAQRHL